MAMPRFLVKADDKQAVWPRIKLTPGDDVA
jgi:hypothetical protein